MRRAFHFALCSLLLAGCATRGKKTSSAGDSSPAEGNVTARTVPGPVQVVGRIIAIDMRTLSVVIELAPFTTMPAGYNERPMVSRTEDLRPTARLKASSYLRGRTLGARLLAGQPQVGHEVVFAPDTP